MKVEYVYQTADQLRDNTYLSLQTPPKHITLELKGVQLIKAAIVLGRISKSHGDSPRTVITKPKCPANLSGALFLG